jgi:UDP-N-acetyl-D-mannosaminuronic acid transferase (WecB/TagA/CpsF family)
MRQINIFNVNFFDASPDEIMDCIKQGGLIVVPAGPALATLEKDYQYTKALEASRFALFDSGFFCLALLVFKGIRVKKFSGLALLRLFLRQDDLKDDSIFLIDPSYQESLLNKALLCEAGFKLSEKHQYVAPIYQNSTVTDPILLEQLKTLRPKFILINLGGGIQECLGAYLQEYLDYHPTILCTGAAIAFLTGQQASIPVWADRFYLGWLARCLAHPKRFIPRYLSSFRLLLLLFKSKVEIKYS